MALTSKLKTYVENLLSLIAQPPVLQNPIAYNNSPSIPPQDSTTKASLNQGFPPIQMQPLASGGLPVQESEMNGLFYYLSQYACFQSQGGQYTYDPNNTAGYAKGAILWCASAGRFLISLKDSNTANFIQQPNYINDDINWNYASFQTLVESVVNTNKILTVLAQLQTTQGIVDSGGITTTGNFVSKRINDSGSVLSFTQRPAFANSTGATQQDLQYYLYQFNIVDFSANFNVFQAFGITTYIPSVPTITRITNMSSANIQSCRARWLQYPAANGALFEMQMSIYVGDSPNSGGSPSFVLNLQKAVNNVISNSNWSVFSVRVNTYSTTSSGYAFGNSNVIDPANPNTTWSNSGGSHTFSQMQFTFFEWSSGVQSGRVEITIQATIAS